MEVHDEPIPEADYATCQRLLPEACVELFLETADGVFVARRTNEPARGEWFWPGSRLYKGEATEAGAHRVGRVELGVEVEVTGLLGVYDHFWDTSAVEGVDSRHTVNVVYRAAPTAEPLEVSLDDQHDAHRFVTRQAPGLHDYVNRYLTDAGYGG